VTAAVAGGAGAATRPSSDASGPPVIVQVFGDSLALTLGYGLGGQPLRSRYNYVLNSLALLGCGVVDGPVVVVTGIYDPPPKPCLGNAPAPRAPVTSQPLPVQWKAALVANHPSVVVLLAGRWETVDRVYGGVWTNILHPTFAAYVKQQLESTSNLVTATGAHLVFLTEPCNDESLQADGAPWPEQDPARRDEYNRLLSQVAAEHPATDSVVDLNALVCPGRRFTSKYNGVTIRKQDGIHFTRSAGQVLGPVILPKILAAGRAAMHQSAKLRADKSPSPTVR
jgi:hypothetical protein